MSLEKRWKRWERARPDCTFACAKWKSWDETITLRRWKSLSALPGKCRLNHSSFYLMRCSGRWNYSCTECAEPSLSAKGGSWWWESFSSNNGEAFKVWSGQNTSGFSRTLLTDRKKNNQLWSSQWCWPDGWSMNDIFSYWAGSKITDWVDLRCWTGSRQHRTVRKGGYERSRMGTWRFRIVL